MYDVEKSSKIFQCEGNPSHINLYFIVYVTYFIPLKKHIYSKCLISCQKYPQDYEILLCT